MGNNTGNRTGAALIWALSVNYAGMVALAVAVNLTPVFLTTFGRELGGVSGLTNEQLGRIGGITFLGLVLGILLTGPLADRLGAKLFAVLGNVFVSLGLLMLGTAQNYTTVLVASAVMGFGAGVLDMVLSPIVCALQPEKRSVAMNLLHSFYCTGAVLTILMGALALKLDWGWRNISLWLSLMPAVVGFCFILLKLPPLVQHEEGRMRLRELIFKPFFLVAVVALFFGGATELAMAQWLPAYAEKQLHFSAWISGMAFLGFSVAMAVGRIGAGILGNKIDPYKIMLACCWSSVAFFLIACSPWWPSVALAACILAGLAGSCLWPCLLGVTADRYPRGGASMFGFLSTFGNFGGVFMPWVVGIIADRSSLATGLMISAACPLLMGILLLWMRKQKGIEN
ncbi:MAG TPA: MFS transporter [Lentisphaeria bacterium]|nr:MAG: hypothetical protein A2X45_20175 [Lentisphaerae bacterium GWF2_50_93]HCE44068.1 MFS transporter [Lentisphaeria bacterium]